MKERQGKEAASAAQRDLPSSQFQLDADSLVVAYGRSIALTIPKLSLRGKIIALIGHNGSGKSTLIKTILQLLLPRQGRMRAFWMQTEDADELVPEKHMAFAPENGAVFEDLTVETYLRLWCDIKQNDRNYYQKAGSRYIERFDIPPLLNKLGRELSKGQRRRVQCAVGFLAKPRLFLCDEPFDGLDIAQSNRLADVMLEEAQDMGLIISSHRMDVVERLADAILVLHDGKIATHGPIEHVCRRLSGQSVVISNGNGHAHHQSSMITELRHRFPDCLINHIGTQISLTGESVELSLVEDFLLSQGLLNGCQLHAVRPSLADAMHYYLRDIRSEREDFSS